jgi:hypothetical protein
MKLHAEGMASSEKIKRAFHLRKLYMDSVIPMSL